MSIFHIRKVNAAASSCTNTGNQMVTRILLASSEEFCFYLYDVQNGNMNVSNTLILWITGLDI